MTADVFDRAKAAADRGVSLVHEDPDLFAGLDEPDLRQAAATVVVPRLRLAPGAWNGVPREPPRTSALLVIEGLLLRNVLVSNRPRAELIGPGDLIRPWQREDATSSVSADVGWHVVLAARIAVLDGRFEAAVGRWPQLASALVARAMRRSQWLALQLAITDVRHIEERLLILFWHLADRWGRVGREGILIPVPITHELLARIVGAQRPTVTSGLRRLASEGLLHRRDDRAWLLSPDGRLSAPQA